MLGWFISVYRMKNGGKAPAAPGSASSAQGKRLASWQAGWGGIDWIEELVKQGKALNLGGDGYPVWFTASAEHLVSPILSGPPEARKVWAYEEGDVLLKEWVGKTVLDQAELKRCSPQEWLLIEVFDES
jgi:hypothetical protein